MASIRTQIEIYDAISAPLMHINNALYATVSAFENVDHAAGSTFDSTNFSNARQHIDAANAAMDDMVQNLNRNDNAQNNFNQSVREGTSAAGGLEKKLFGMAAAYASFQSIGKLINLSDTMVSTEARLSLIVDDGGSVEELQNKIFESSQNARANYLDTAAAIAKMGMNAGNAFSGNDELIAFMDQVNKQFVIGGASATEQSSAMMQLTQAMAAGALRGEELNSILDGAPGIARSIEESMGWAEGSIKSYAEEGLVTATVVKNALLSTAEATNAAFESMPMTWSQVWNGVMNNLLMIGQPVLDFISLLAQNWNTLEPIVLGAAAALGVYAVGLGIQTVATWIATGAAKAFFTTLMTNPLFWIALAIGLVVGAIYKWVQSVGGIKVAWLMTMNAIMTAWDWVQIGFFTGVYWIMGLWDKMTLGIMAASNGIQNFMGDMKAGVLSILQDMVNGAIGIINDFIGILNKIPGVSIDTVQQVTFGTTAQLENDAAKIARGNELQNYQDEIAAKMIERDASINQMKNDAIYATEQRQVNIDIVRVEATKANDNANSGAASTVPSDIADIAENTGSIKDSLTISEENLKYMRDAAEMETINRFTTAEIKVDMGGITNNVNSNMDLDGVVSYLGEGVNEAMEKAAEGVHS